MLNVELSYAYPCTSKLRRIYTDLIMRYKIVFGIVKLEIGNFFPLTLPFLAYASPNGSSLESLRARPTQSSHTKCYMDVHQVTSGHLSASPMCLFVEPWTSVLTPPPERETVVLIQRSMVEHSAPPARIASSCRQSRPPPSAVEPSRSLPH